MSKLILKYKTISLGSIACILLAYSATAQFANLQSRSVGTIYKNQLGESIDRIVVNRSNNVTADLQTAVTQAGDRIEIIFDTESCELFGLEILDKKMVRIRSIGDVTIRLPAKRYKQSDKSLNVIRIINCDTVISDARITFDGSNTKFSRAEDDFALSSFSLHIEGTGRLVEISNLSNRDNGIGGVYVKAALDTEPGYRKVHLHDLESYNSPLNISHVRGGHRSIVIEDVYAEDPACKSIYGLNSAEATVVVSSEVRQREFNTEMVHVENIYSRYATSSVYVKQACRHSVVEDVLIRDRGFDGKGNDTPIRYQGGPSTKIDNVFWYGPNFAHVNRYRTVNTNKTKGYLSAWVGQAADQNITFSDCDFDADVVFAGGGNPKRPGFEGWSRLGVVRDSVFRGVARGGNHARIENCRFIAETINDPEVKTSQHDDFDRSFGPATIGLRLSETMQCIDCDFFGTVVLVEGKGNHRIDRPKFFAGAKLVSGNHYSGQCLIEQPQNLSVRCDFNVTEGAGLIKIFRPTGTYEEESNVDGPGGAVKIIIETGESATSK